jgi:hypothetical protein
MSDIYYSRVNSNLQLELNARGRAGKTSRTTADLQYMLGKLANVELRAYEFPTTGSAPGIVTRGNEIKFARLGGSTTRSDRYIPTGPGGFLNNQRTYDTSNIRDILGQEYTFTTRKLLDRIGPIITSAEISIGDNSHGLLNTATINITIPDPQTDLNFIESVYFRPGRPITLHMVHPDDAVITNVETGGRLADEPLTSTKRILELDSDVSAQYASKYKQQKLNEIEFEGIITSFTIDYQTDMSVQATISVRGTTQVYTDLTLLTTTTTKESDPIATEAESDAALQDVSDSFYSRLYNEVNTLYTTQTQNQEVPADFWEKNGFRGEYRILENVELTSGKDRWWQRGGQTITPGVIEFYITIGWVIDYINRIIIDRIKTTSQPAARILFNSEYGHSNYYANLISTNHRDIIIPTENGYVYKRNVDGTVAKAAYWNDESSLLDWVNQIQFNEITDNEIDNYSKPQRIFIRLSTIKEIVDDLKTKNQFTVNALITRISLMISAATSKAIELTLITHPDIDNVLLLYDRKHATLSNTVEPYSVPMFANHPNGTITRDFKFSGKLPESAGSLAYVTNQDPADISESEIAPFLSYMYQRSIVSREINTDGSAIAITDGIGDLATLNKLQDQWEANYTRFLTELNATKEAYADSPTRETQIAFSAALTKHLQYPTPTPSTSNQTAAPVIPFTVEFTIDGINGFRYGDVLTFNGLPDRYKQNVVFCVANVTHTINTDHQWVTTIRCFTRPKI